MNTLVKLLLLPMMLLFTCSSSSLAQESSQPIIKIFGNYHHGLTGEVQNETAFEILRAYLGYKHTWDNGWKAQVKLDIGSPDDLSQYSLIRRYAYFKNAYISYSHNDIELGAGLVDMLNIDIPESYWGHRYIMKEFQDEYKFGPSADIGVYGVYSPGSRWSLDVFMVNGEGYKNLQRDNVYRYGFGISFYPFEQFILRAHYDLAIKETIQHNASLFAGYELGNLGTLGIQGVYQKNANFLDGEDLYGFSFFGMYNIAKNWEILARYDILRSSLDETVGIPWNLTKDGSAIVAGVQYRITDFLKVSLNYQDWYSYAQNGQDKSYIYLNMEVAL